MPTHNFKFYYLLIFLAAGMVAIGCNDDDDHDDGHDDNEVTITIDEPANNEVITDCTEVHIHVDVVATDENHELEIALFVQDDSENKIIDVDMHDHDKEITFTQDVDLCGYDSGTCFTLEVIACVDHDCEETATATSNFCLQ